MVGWLVGRSVGRSVGWLVGWCWFVDDGWPLALHAHSPHRFRFARGLPCARAARRMQLRGGAHARRAVPRNFAEHGQRQRLPHRGSLLLVAFCWIWPGLRSKGLGETIKTWRPKGSMVVYYMTVVPIQIPTLKPKGGFGPVHAWPQINQRTAKWSKAIRTPRETWSTPRNGSHGQNDFMID